MKTAKIETKASIIKKQLDRLVECANKGDAETISELLDDIKFNLSVIEKAAN